jgi:hypothetical protein
MESFAAQFVKVHVIRPGLRLVAVFGYAGQGYGLEFWS